MADMLNEQEMRVIKRNGTNQVVAFDKILNRVKKIGNDCGISINYPSLIMKVIDQLYDGIPTSKIDDLTAEQCASLSVQHPDYGILASHIVISNHQKNTYSAFFSVMEKLYNFLDFHGGKSPLISEQLWDIVKKNKDFFEELIDYKRDYLIDYFGFKTLERAYLMRMHDTIVERPQHMWLRVSIGIHGNNLEKVKKTYDLMSQKYFTHATPTLFNAGTPRPQLSSCYLIAMEEDSIDGIYNTLKDCAKISKWAGGIGLHIHNIRASGSHIRGTNGTSNGIIPMLRVFNNTARYVDQCIAPDTWIYTTQGPMKMKNLISGETKIFNSVGKYEKISNILEHSYDDEIYHIKTIHSIDELKITAEHPILILPRRNKTLNKITIDHLEWKSAKDLTSHDMIVSRRPTYEKDILHITDDDCYVYGILLGEGHMSNGDTTTYICLKKHHKSKILNFLQNYFDSHYTPYSLSTDEDTTKIRWEKNISLPFKYSDIYDIKNEKYIAPRFINLPLKKAKFILKGLIDINGCVENKLTFGSTNRNLIENVRYILLRMGLLTSEGIRGKVKLSSFDDYDECCKNAENNNNFTKKEKNYCIKIPQTVEMCKLMEIKEKNICFKFLVHGDFLMSQIKSITKSHYKGILYDLQMKETHDYMIHNGLIHNGGGKRNGSFAIYIEPWHADIEDFLELKKNQGDEEMKARDLFYALWIPDLFMEKIKANEDWCLFCPNECEGLYDNYGDDFRHLYEKYENEKKYKRKIKARDLWFKVLDSQMETGTPYILFKDAANKKSNQKNLGTIRSSNLCTEIIEYSDKNETAVCNLASIGLSNFVKEDKTFDYDKLHSVTKVVTDNLNCVIDVNFYPTPKTKLSNMRHRPIGIGVQGLADAFMKMNLAYHSKEAIEVNKLIFETIYHAALEASNEISIERMKNIKTPGITLSEEEWGNLSGDLLGAYSSFVGSPTSKGILQFDMWNVTPSDRYDWKTLKQSIMQYGIRNSLLLAPMPTASTAQILGNNECFEPFTSNIYTRRTLAGEFIIVNKYLMHDLLKLNIWNENIKNNIIENKGSVQQITELPEHIKNKYKIVWEIPMKHLIDMARDRGAFICQSQSLNLWLEDPNYNSLTSMHFYSWKQGLKTGIYYLRRKPKHQPQQFTIEPEKTNINTDADTKTQITDNSEEHEICEMCQG